MFDIFAKLLSTVATFLFPVFASYKALNTSDPALLKPWLMYWVVLACALLAESWTEFILVWIPFYAWIRAGFLLYLIAPQTQGARILYQEHVHPFLREHEITIDDFISSAHDRAKMAGLKYLKQAIELFKQHVLGLPPQQPSRPSTPAPQSYTQSLIARFNLPNARPTFSAGNLGGAATSTATDFYSLLASAVTAATSSAALNYTSADGSKEHDLSNSGMLIPPTMQGEDRISFIAAQRERLSILLSALDKEASQLKAQDAQSTSAKRVPSMFFDGSGNNQEDQRPASAMSGLSKSRSEGDFERIEREESVEDGIRPLINRESSGSWLPWSWGAKGSASAPKKEVEDNAVIGVTTSTDEAKSSSVDI